MSEVITKQDTVEDLDILNPGKYKVVILNDDKTPIEFVIVLLMRVFHHSQSAAESLTMKIHHEGSAVAGVYTYEVSEQKAIEGTNLARENDFPLVIKVEAE